MRVRDWQACPVSKSAHLVLKPTPAKLGYMADLDVNKLRQRAFPSFSEAEREEAGRILRAYLAVCARIYEQSKLKELFPKQSKPNDSTKGG